MIQSGDLILFPVDSSSGWMSKLVGWGQRVIGQAPTVRQYSHVAIVSEDINSMYEAYWPKIRYSPLRSGDIFRIKDLTPADLQKGMAYLKSRLGTWYDMVAILTFGKIQLGGTEVCSQLAYDYGLSMSKVLYDPELLESPDDIAASPLLTKIQ